MTELYKDISRELSIAVNKSVLEEMESKNAEEISKLTGMSYY